ncbi:hypothetical protein [Caldalkalibacillus salinus]|uniref:hypothetical protein n=1 Tax=Caldalkalibacillus salinus TaxID=2803787 RepID=UPI001922A9F5|nr:hypothetical protein [Caldalkalibacillus salinus]
MAKTPYQDLTSQDILSAHISGLQHSINKLEHVLKMDTQSIAGHTLQPVIDQDDPQFRYRIFEGEIRNWLAEPVPTIYRNGQLVNTEEYILQPAYGVVVFNTQQAPDDQITADFDYVRERSRALEEVGGGVPQIHPPGLWRTNNRVAGYTSSEVYIGPNLCDAYPFPVTNTTTYNAMGIRVDVASGSGTTARLGIYKDNGAMYPGERVLDAGTLPTDQTGAFILEMAATLEPGLYWLVRNSDGGPGLTGLGREYVYPVGMDESLVGSPAGAYRVTLSYGPLPDVFPEGASPLFRSHYPSIWVRRA